MNKVRKNQEKSHSKWQYLKTRHHTAAHHPWMVFYHGMFSKTAAVSWWAFNLVHITSLYSIFNTIVIMVCALEVTRWYSYLVGYYCCCHIDVHLFKFIHIKIPTTVQCNLIRDSSYAYYNIFYCAMQFSISIFFSLNFSVQFYIWFFFVCAEPQNGMIVAWQSF